MVLETLLKYAPQVFRDFIISYAAGFLQSKIEEKKEHKDLIEKIKVLHTEAIKACYPNFSKNDIMIAFQEDQDILQKYLKGEVKNISRSAHIFLNYWASLLRKDSMCYNYILELKLDECIDFQKNRAKLLEILSKQYDESSTKILNTVETRLDDLKNWFSSKELRGIINHKPQENYMERLCGFRENKPGSLSKCQKFSLFDIVRGNINYNCDYRYILYASAHCGKTTELRQLAWKLQETEQYFPILIELKSCKNLMIQHLPSDYLLEGKIVVLIIDALDETTEEERKLLYSTITEYTQKHPYIPIVLSCRSNYRREGALSQFTELELLNLNWYDVKNIIVNQYKSDASNIITDIEDNSLYTLVQDPFYLNVILNGYNKKEGVLSNVIDIYEESIHQYFKKEKQKIILDDYPSLNEEQVIDLLMKLALVMQIMGEHKIKREKLQEIGISKTNIPELRRYGILEENDEFLYYKDNFIKEYLAARYLKSKAFISVKELCCYDHTNVIISHWIDTIYLYASCIIKDNGKLPDCILEWLLTNNKEVLVRVDASSISNETRILLFKELLTDCKKLGIRYANSFSDGYKKLMKFGDLDDLYEWIALEMETCEIDSPYLSDLIFLLLESNISQMSEATINHIQKVYKSILEKLQCHQEYEGAHLFLTELSIFKTKEFLDYLVDLFNKTDKHYIIKPVIHLIRNLDLVDDYLTFILDHEKFIHNITTGNSTHVVSRLEIYESLSCARIKSNIVKILQLMYIKPSEYTCESEECVCNSLIKNVKTLSSQITQEDTEIKNLIIQLYDRTVCLGSFSNNDLKKKLIDVYRDCYSKINDGVSDFDTFIEDQKNEKLNWSKISHLNLWVDNESYRNILKHLQEQKNKKNLAQQISNATSLSLGNYAEKLYEDMFSEVIDHRSPDEILQCNFNEKCKHYDNNKLELLLYVGNILLDRESKIKVPQPIINKVNDISKTIINNAIDEEVYDYRAIRIACKLLMNKYFVIDESHISRLLEIADICVIPFINDRFESKYYTILFYMKDVLGKEKTKELLLQHLKNQQKKLKDLSFEYWGEYIIDEKVTEAYHYLHDYINEAQLKPGAYDLINRMISKNCEINVLWQNCHNWDLTLRLSFFSALLKNNEDTKKIEGVLVPDYLKFNVQNQIEALRILVSIGSIHALQYIVKNKNLSISNKDFAFNYNQIESLPLLCELIKRLHSKRIENHMELSTLINSIGRIAVQSDEFLEKTRQYFDDIIKEDHSCSWLNYHFIIYKKKRLDENEIKHSFEDAIIFIQCIS